MFAVRTKTTTLNFVAAMLLICTGLLFCNSQPANAESLYSISINSTSHPGYSYVINFNSAEEVDNQISLETIQQHIPGYTDSDPMRASLNFRGLPVVVRFDANSPTMYFSIPAIGVSETFAGADRNASVNMLEEWFKSKGGDALTRMSQYLAEHTPTDPVAGNPTSLQSNLVSSAFEQAFAANTTQLRDSSVNVTPNSRNSNLIGVSARFGTLKAGGLEGNYYSLPLSYTFRSNDDPRKSFTLKLPIHMVEVDGAKSYNIGLGASMTLPINNQWSITPGLQYAFMGSLEMGSAAQMVAGSVTSAYTWDLGSNYRLSMGNMIGYYKTMKFKYQDYEFDPDIQNTVLRNGLMLSIPTDGLYKDTLVEVFATDTRFFGSELYIDSYDEIGFAFGFSKFSIKEMPEYIVNTMRDLRIGVSYLFASDSNLLTLNFGFTF